MTDNSISEATVTSNNTTTTTTTNNKPLAFVRPAQRNFYMNDMFNRSMMIASETVVVAVVAVVPVSVVGVIYLLLLLLLAR